MRQLVKKENSEFKPVKLRLKIDLVSYPARAEGSVNMYTNNFKTSFLLIDGTLTGTATLGLSGSESNDNEGVFYTPKPRPQHHLYSIITLSKTTFSLTGILILCRDAGNIYYASSTGYFRKKIRF